MIRVTYFRPRSRAGQRHSALIRANYFRPRSGQVVSSKKGSVGAVLVECYHALVCTPLLPPSPWVNLAITINPKSLPTGGTSTSGEAQPLVYNKGGVHTKLPEIDIPTWLVLDISDSHGTAWHSILAHVKSCQQLGPQKIAGY